MNDLDQNGPWWLILILHWDRDVEDEIDWFTEMLCWARFGYRLLCCPFWIVLNPRSGAPGAVWVCPNPLQHRLWSHGAAKGLGLSPGEGLSKQHVSVPCMLPLFAPHRATGKTGPKDPVPDVHSVAVKLTISSKLQILPLTILLRFSNVQPWYEVFLLLEINSLCMVSCGFYTAGATVAGNCTK